MFRLLSLTVFINIQHNYADLSVVRNTINRSFATRVSQHKICDCLGKTFKGFEVL
jgi:hypothetical protein